MLDVGKLRLTKGETDSAIMFRATGFTDDEGVAEAALRKALTGIIEFADRCKLMSTGSCPPFMAAGLLRDAMSDVGLAPWKEEGEGCLA